jgi:hypothetical protein
VNRYYSTAEVAEAHGLTPERAASLLARWRDYLDPIVPPTGSGSRAIWSARDVEMLQLLRDCSVGLYGPLRADLIQALREAPEDVDGLVVRVGLGPFVITYGPTWTTE